MTNAGNDTVFVVAEEKCAREADVVGTRKRVRVGSRENHQFRGQSRVPKRANDRESSAKPSRREE
jgi:hypothetical protein